MMVSELIQQLQFVLDNNDDMPVAVARTNQDTPYADDLDAWAEPLRVLPECLFNLESGVDHYALIHARPYPEGGQVP